MAYGCVEQPAQSWNGCCTSRQLSAESLLQFAKVTEAGNRVVMADNQTLRRRRPRDLSAATEGVARDTAELANELKELSYSKEAGLLEEFQKRFAEFRAVDREIIELAELDTNIQAQRLSFGAAQEAADALSDSLAMIVQKSPNDDWRVRALAAEILSSIREIQALQAPHIAEPDDAAMDRLEERIGRAQSSAQKNLSALATSRQSRIQARRSRPPHRRSIGSSAFTARSSSCHVATATCARSPLRSGDAERSAPCARSTFEPFRTSFPNGR